MSSNESNSSSTGLPSSCNHTRTSSSQLLFDPSREAAAISTYRIAALTQSPPALHTPQTHLPAARHTPLPSHCPLVLPCSLYPQPAMLQCHPTACLLVAPPSTCLMISLATSPLNPGTLSCSRLSSSVYSFGRMSILHGPRHRHVARQNTDQAAFIHDIGGVGDPGSGLV